MRGILAGDFCSLLLVAVAGHVTAGAVARRLPRFAGAMGWAAVSALLAVCAWGYAELRPTTPLEILGTLVVAWVVASAAALFTATLLPPLAAVHDGWRSMRAAWRAEAEREEAERRKAVDDAAAEGRRRALEAWRRAEEANRPPPPPPPTPEQVVAAARRRHDDAVRLLEAAGLGGVELEAGKRRAKLKFLEEIDGVM